ncbi:hypothetical protein AGLY_014460 [Aphis glycines]|uniref:Transmembrane protein n=1 Tax=Aphis glycines TaxID=307491 RepID=A0A6G0T333_APHGL|nr:hypothetical protein AGLY_014460 [Aphis glycines]
MCMLNNILILFYHLPSYFLFMYIFKFIVGFNMVVLGLKEILPDKQFSVHNFKYYKNKLIRKINGFQAKYLLKIRTFTLILIVNRQLNYYKSHEIKSLHIRLLRIYSTELEHMILIYGYKKEPLQILHIYLKDLFHSPCYNCIYFHIHQLIHHQLLLKLPLVLLYPILHILSLFEEVLLTQTHLHHCQPDPKELDHGFAKMPICRNIQILTNFINFFCYNIYIWIQIFKRCNYTTLCRSISFSLQIIFTLNITQYELQLKHQDNQQMINNIIYLINYSQISFLHNIANYFTCFMSNRY